MNRCWKGVDKALINDQNDDEVIRVGEAERRKKKEREDAARDAVRLAWERERVIGLL